MTDPTPPNPLDTVSGSESGEQPNPIARSALAVMRRTEQALSPWSRRLLQAESAPTGTVQRSPDLAAPSARAPRSPVVAVRNPTVTGKAALTLARRAHRAEMPAVIQRSPEPRTALSLDRFAEKVVRRFPEVASKYQAKPAEAPETIQRAPLPFVGSDSPASESSTSMPMPAVELPAADDNETPFYPSISTQESVASQLADRLQTFRDQTSNTPSPREISRKTAERAARTRTDSNQPIIRRSRVEELGNQSVSRPSRSEEAAPTTPKPAAPRETVQRKPVERPIAEPQTPTPVQEVAPKPAADQSKPSIKPASRVAPRPTVQRKPALPFQDESSSEAEANLGPRPDLPSLSQQLVQRYQAGRDEWDAESGTDSELPSFLRPASAPESAKPSTVQRKPDSDEPPSIPTQPSAIEHRESRPARRAAQPKPAPAIQRKPQPDSGEPTDTLPLAQPPASPAPSALTPTIQRSPEEPENQAAGELPAAIEPAKPASKATVPVTPEMPLAQPPATIQRKPSIESTRDSALPEAPGASSVTSTTAPAVQRAPQVEPAPSESRQSLVRPLGPESARPEASLPQSPEPSQPAGQSSAEPPSIQRSVAELPLSQPPTSQSTLPTSEPIESSEPTVTPRAEVAAPAAPRPSLPLSAPPSVQRKTEALPIPETWQPEPSSELPPPATQSPAPAVSVQRKLTPEAHQANLPLAAPRGEMPAPASVAPTIQRMPDDSAPMPQAMPLVALREPTPGPQAATKPMAIVQRKPAEIATATLDLPFPTLPLARVAPSPSSQIQREISTDTASPDTTTTRSSVDESSGGEGKKSTVDLNDLARRIYPILKRMLAIERERR